MLTYNYLIPSFKHPWVKTSDNYLLDTKYRFVALLMKCHAEQIEHIVQRKKFLPSGYKAFSNSPFGVDRFGFDDIMLT